MTIDEIRIAKSDLEIQLQHAIATMELNNQIKQIRKHILQLQEECPHKESGINYTNNKKCPICGKKFE